MYGFSTRLGPITWQAPASGELRKWVPTIVSLEMMRVMYTLFSTTEDRFEIKNGALSAKLARFGARRVIPKDTTDTRGRILLHHAQMTFWTWDKNWLHRDRDDYIEEYLRVIKQFPELDTAPYKKAKY